MADGGGYCGLESGVIYLILGGGLDWYDEAV